VTSNRRRTVERLSRYTAVAVLVVAGFCPVHAQTAGEPKGNAANKGIKTSDLRGQVAEVGYDSFMARHAQG
jgi:hypothetical protein